MLASFTDVTVAYGETEILKNVTAAINERRRKNDVAQYFGEADTPGGGHGDP